MPFEQSFHYKNLGMTYIIYEDEFKGRRCFKTIRQLLLFLEEFHSITHLGTKAEKGNKGQIMII